MKDGDVRVEKCIVRREKGTYAVSVSVNGQYHAASFPTLKAAREFRDGLIAKRPSREEARGRRREKGYSYFLSGEETAQNQTVRDVLAKAPRTTIERGGRVWTLISLPPAGESS